MFLIAFFPNLTATTATTTATMTKTMEKAMQYILRLLTNTPVFLGGDLSEAGMLYNFEFNEIMIDHKVH